MVDKYCTRFPMKVRDVPRPKEDVSFNLDIFYLIPQSCRAATKTVVDILEDRGRCRNR